MTFVPNPTLDEWEAEHPLIYPEIDLPVLVGDFVYFRVRWCDLPYIDEVERDFIDGRVVGRRGSMVLVDTNLNSIEMFPPEKLTLIRREDEKDLAAAHAIEFAKQRAAERAYEDEKDHA